MGKRFLYPVLFCCMLGITVHLTGCDQVDTHGKIQNNEGLSVAYLSQEGKKPAIKVFNFDQNKVVKKMEPDNKDINTLSVISYFNQVEQKTLLLSQHVTKDKDGHSVYIQDKDKIKEVGFIKARIDDLVFKGNYVYAASLVPPDYKSQKLQKFHISNLNEPIQSWDIEGEPQQLLIHQDSGAVYTICADKKRDKTVLTTVDSSGECTKRDLFNKSIRLHATMDKQQIWIACEFILSNTVDKCKDMNDVFVYDLVSKKVEKKFETEEPPKLIRMTQDKLFLITEENNEGVEIFDRKTFKSINEFKLPSGMDVFGFIVTKDRPVLFTNHGIYEIEKGHVNRLVEEQNNQLNKRIDS